MPELKKQQGVYFAGMVLFSADMLINDIFNDIRPEIPRNGNRGMQQIFFDPAL